jgi:hypothetical protein
MRAGAGQPRSHSIAVGTGPDLDDVSTSPIERTRARVDTGAGADAVDSEEDDETARSESDLRSGRTAEVDEDTTHGGEDDGGDGSEDIDDLEDALAREKEEHIETIEALQRATHELEEERRRTRALSQALVGKGEPVRKHCVCCLCMTATTTIGTNSHINGTITTTTATAATTVITVTITVTSTTNNTTTTKPPLFICTCSHSHSLPRSLPLSALHHHRSCLHNHHLSSAQKKHQFVTLARQLKSATLQWLASPR